MNTIFGTIFSTIFSTAFSTIYRDIILCFCIVGHVETLDGGFERECDGGDGAVTFNRGAGTGQVLPACEFLHAVTGIFRYADIAEKFGYGRIAELGIYFADDFIDGEREGIAVHKLNVVGVDADAGTERVEVVAVHDHICQGLTKHFILTLVGDGETVILDMYRSVDECAEPAKNNRFHITTKRKRASDPTKRCRSSRILKWG